jgi:hypothetical protein
MNAATPTTRYLLGELPAEEQAAFEKAYFEDPRVFAEVSDAETALIDDYVRGRLSPEMRGRFEQVYLADPRRRERVAFAEALAARVDARSATGTKSGGAGWRFTWESTRPLAFAAAIVFAMAALMWYISQPLTNRQESTQATAPDAPGRVAPPTPENRTAPDASASARENSGELRRDRAEAASGRKGGPPAPIAPLTPGVPPTLALVLAPGARDAGASPPATWTIPAGATEVRLALTIREPESQRLRVILRAVGGAEIARRDLTLRAGATGAAVTLTLAASRFDSGDYLLTLQGAARDGEFEDLSQSLVHVSKR